MFGNLFTRNPYASSGLSLSGIVNGINRTLNIANQAIPIYQKSKPLFKNANTIFKTIQEFSARPVFNKEDKPIGEEKIKKVETINNSGPTFFI